MQRIAALEKRIAALKATIPHPPTFEEFCRTYETADALSKSLYLAMAGDLSCALSSDGALYAEYFRRMGVEVEATNFAGIVERMEQERVEAHKGGAKLAL